MKHRNNSHNEYMIAAFAFSLLSLVGSLFGIINIITLMITYQMINHAKEIGLTSQQEKLLSRLFNANLLLTFCISILYFTIKI